jgi:hypothetical protein
MTIVERVDLISEQIQTMPLSKLLVQILPIALDCNDFEGYSIYLVGISLFVKTKQRIRCFSTKLQV